jgi:hypothetical protein
VGWVGATLDQKFRILTELSGTCMDMPVSALFVDPHGVYPKLLGSAFCWDGSLFFDAREYAGPWPVVAHPPCHLWVNLAAVNFKRYGGEHNRPGNDGGRFASALESVRRWGGVLEHPAGSNAWAAFGLSRPRGVGWQRAGEREWVCEVWQSAYGHRARKRTWLLYVGPVPPGPGNWSRSPGTHQCGWFDRIKPTLSKAEASRTPEPFARWLIELAEQANSR